MPAQRKVSALRARGVADLQADPHDRSFRRAPSTMGTLVAVREGRSAASASAGANGARRCAMTLEEELVSAWGKREPGLPNLRKLAAIARPRECPAGAVLFREGDDSPFIFVL